MPRFVLQLIRFGGIGLLNTAVDFGVLNFLASFFGVYKGLPLGFLNILSFSAAVVHSFYWNKYWAFGDDDFRFIKNLLKFGLTALVGAGLTFGAIFGAKQNYGPGYFVAVLAVLAVGEIMLWHFLKLDKAFGRDGSTVEFGLFLAVSIGGVVINSALVVGVTDQIEPKFGFDEQLWANLAKALATAVSLVWNFLGYKLLVFKK